MSFLSPLDLLTVSDNEQDVFRCLVRHPELTMGEISNFVKIPIAELENLLSRMVNNSQLLRDDKKRFQVTYGKSNKPEQTRNGNSLLDSLFN